MVKCLFMKYAAQQVDKNFEASYQSYGTLLKKCKCPNCMKEKEIRKRIKEREGQE